MRKDLAGACHLPAEVFFRKLDSGPMACDTGAMFSFHSAWHRAAEAACASLCFACLAAAAPAQETGVASWYGKMFHGRLTANGERFNMYAMTAAHKRLPFGSVVRVRQAGSGRSVVVRINDRGPFVEGRIIDLSRSAAQSLGMEGISRVTLEVVAGRSGKPYAAAQRFFVRLGREGVPQERDDGKKAAQLVCLGVRDAATLLRRSGEGYVIGPFSSFQDAHDIFAQVELFHPGAGITLMEKNGAEPVFPEYQSE